MSPGVLPAVITVSSWKSLYGLTVAPCLPKHDAPRLRSPPATHGKHFMSRSPNFKAIWFWNSHDLFYSRYLNQLKLDSDTLGPIISWLITIFRTFSIFFPWLITIFPMVAMEISGISLFFARKPLAHPPNLRTPGQEPMPHRVSPHAQAVGATLPSTCLVGWISTSRVLSFLLVGLRSCILISWAI